VTPSSTAQSQAAVSHCKLWHDPVWYCLCSVRCITIVYTTTADWLL